MSAINAADWTLAALSDALRKKDISPIEITRTCLEWIAAHDRRPSGQREGDAGSRLQDDQRRVGLRAPAATAERHVQVDPIRHTSDAELTLKVAVDKARLTTYR